MSDGLPQIVEHFFRHEYSRLVAALTRRFGVRHLGLAEDVVQSAMVRALRSWSIRGIPPNPGAWLHRVALNSALDRLRRDMRWSSFDGQRQLPDANIITIDTTDIDFEDDLLRMMFVACDPALPAEWQVALALKTLCGFHPREIARAFLTSEANIAKRITRAKDRLRTSGIDPNSLSEIDIKARLPNVLEVIYLVFNEGYCSSQPDKVIRDDLCEEAVRLALILAEHPLTANSETAAFLALLLFHASRLESRLEPIGSLCLLEDQDRRRWDWRLIGEAFKWFQVATRGDVVTRYHAEAWIAAEHCRTPDFRDTDWAKIVEAYDLLLRLAPSPIHALNRAIAISRLHGAEAARAALQVIPSDQVPESYYLWHATLAEFSRMSNDPESAARSLKRAIELAPTCAERDLLTSRFEQWFPDHNEENPPRIGGFFVG